MRQGSISIGSRQDIWFGMPGSNRSYNIPWQWPCHIEHVDNFVFPTLCVAFVDVSNGHSAVISYISTKHFAVSLNGVFLTKCQNQLLLEDVLENEPVPSPMTWRSRPVLVGESSSERSRVRLARWRQNSKHDVRSAGAVLWFELQIKIEFIRFNRAL